RIRADFQCRVDLLGVEAAAAEEARLPRPFDIVPGRQRAEPLGADATGQGRPVLAGRAHRRFGPVRPTAPLPELGPGLLRPRAPAGARRDETGYETLTAQQPVLFQAVQRLSDERRREAARGELTLELAAAVLAAGQEGDGAPLAFGR